jgi:hypothetical protein
MDTQAQLDIIHALGASHYVVSQLTDVGDIGKQQVARQYRSVGFSRLSRGTRGSFSLDNEQRFVSPS